MSRGEAILLGIFFLVIPWTPARHGLAANAHDAMPNGGTLVIETRSEAAFVKILISDTGVGIQPGLRSRIFDRDFSTKPHGHGIGLALARDTVDEAGGFIEVDSDLGQGATFTLAFPTRGGGR